MKVEVGSSVGVETRSQDTDGGVCVVRKVIIILFKYLFIDWFRLTEKKLGLGH